MARYPPNSDVFNCRRKESYLGALYSYQSCQLTQLISTDQWATKRRARVLGKDGKKEAFHARSPYPRTLAHSRPVADLFIQAGLTDNIFFYVPLSFTKNRLDACVEI